MCFYLYFLQYMHEQSLFSNEMYRVFYFQFENIYSSVNDFKIMVLLTMSARLHFPWTKL